VMVRCTEAMIEELQITHISDVIEVQHMTLRCRKENARGSVLFANVVTHCFKKLLTISHFEWLSVSFLLGIS